MAVVFPPQPVYPDALDSDRTLFLVFNTTETFLREDNQPWADEIPIVPVDANDLEIWADNGFGTIEGELFYYDSVEKDSNGKVNLLKNIARNIGGEETQFNKKGTYVRSFVIAEHHNQIATGIIQTENFIGINFDPRTFTLDFRIRNLADLSTIEDDFDCPDVDFTFVIVDEDPTAGITTTFDVVVSGRFNNYRLDFGDGTFTTTEFSGTHVYALNAPVDPVITIGNDKCQIVQTAIERTNPQEPPSIVEIPFEIPIPECPEFPDFLFVPCEVPTTEINLPPLITTCDIATGAIAGTGTSIIIPSVIDSNIPSTISVTGVQNPSQIEISGASVPSIVTIDPPVPPTIVIDPPIPPCIELIIPSSNLILEMDIANMPLLEINWGLPPAVEVQLAMARPVKQTTQVTSLGNEFGDEFADLFGADNKVKVEYEKVGLPEEIKLMAPDMIPDIRINAEELPKAIKVEGSDIPKEIKIYGPETPIPDTIQVIGPVEALPDKIEIIHDLPEVIEVIAAGIPEEIVLRHNLPEKILVEQVTPLPTEIRLDASEVPEQIQLVGAPERILLDIPEDAFTLKMPENPEIEMVYKGAPIEVKVSLQDIMPVDENGNQQCVMIVPCSN